MKKQLSLLLISFFGTMFCFSQGLGDSLMALRKTAQLDGKIKTVYTPGNEAIARNLQKLLTEAAGYFEKEYGVQWTKEYSPYGYLLYRDGWMIMNTGMDFSVFKKVYRFESMSGAIDSAIQKNHISPEQLISSFNNFYGVHKLAHYFIYELTKVKYHDRFTDEFIATYLAYQFYINNRNADLRPFEMISALNRDFYKPNYASVPDLVEANSIGLANYLWYHSHFLFLLAHDLYSCKGKDFVSAYEKIFSDPASSKLTTDETTNLLGPTMS